MLPATKEKNLKLISLFSSARVLSELFYFFRGMLLAKILGPSTLGIWTQMKLVLMFLVYSHLGTSDAMLREVPYAVGQGNAARADTVKRASWGLNLVTSSVLALCLFCYFFLVPQGEERSTRLAWIIFALFFPVSQVFWYAVFRLQSERQIGRSGLMIFGFAVASTVLGTVAAFFWGLPGLLTALAVSHFLMLFAGGGLKVYFAPLFNFGLIRELIAKGFPIMVSVALLVLLWNVDKIMINLLIDTRSLGIYALQSYMSNMLMIIPHAVSTVLYPSLMEKIGKARDEATLKRYLTQPTLAMSYLICPLLGAIFLAFHIPIHWLLPQYMMAVLPGQIMVFAFFFTILSRMPVTILVSLNRQNLLMMLTLMAVLSGFLFNWLFIMHGFGLAGAAIGTGLSFLVYASLTLFFAMREIRMPGREVAVFLAHSLAPYLACLVFSLLVHRYFPSPAASLVADMLGCGVRIVTVFAGMALLYAILNRRFDIFHLIFGRP
jgi:O-antigen/teichoic acid export membrane protein